MTTRVVDSTGGSKGGRARNVAGRVRVGGAVIVTVRRGLSRAQRERPVATNQEPEPAAVSGPCGDPAGIRSGAVPRAAREPAGGGVRAGHRTKRWPDVASLTLARGPTTTGCASERGGPWSTTWASREIRRSPPWLLEIQEPEPGDGRPITSPERRRTPSAARRHDRCHVYVLDASAGRPGWRPTSCRSRRTPDGLRCSRKYRIRSTRSGDD